MKGIKGLIQKMPESWVHEARRFRYRMLIRHRHFISRELEYPRLNGIIQPDDVVLDIGANVGHYTLLFSGLVESKGRVIAFEPMLSTFDLLTSNIQAAQCSNVTLINTAITERAEEIGFTTPNGNFYQSHRSQQGDCMVLSYPLTRFVQDERAPGFIKIDAEGCDMPILLDSLAYISRTRPIVMAEIQLQKLHNLAQKMTDYQAVALKSSHNAFLVPTEKRQRFTHEFLACG